MNISLPLTPEELQPLSGLILAGGKSSKTGADGLMSAAHFLAKLQAAANEANTPKADEPSEKEPE